MNEFLEPFLEEARELVETAGTDLLALEDAPRDAPRLDSLFRAFHTLKGSAGIVEFPAMARACHAVEDALERVRRGEGLLGAPLIDAALACLDQVTRWLDAMAETGEPPADADAAADRIVAGLAGDATAADPRMGEVPGMADGVAGRAILEAQIALLAAATPDDLVGRAVSAGRVATNVLHHLGRHADVARIDAALAESRAAADAQPLAAALAGLLDAESRDAAAASESGPRALRVPVERIDALVHLTGELTVVKNALGHLGRGGDEPQHVAAGLKAQQALLDRLVRELQQLVLGIRVLPLRVAFQRFPRLVREIAAGLERPVRLVVSGDETEADKVVVEALSEPLLHVLRNAIDHGIERAAARAASGKPKVATIALRASRESENVVVEVEDDGAGIDLAKVRAVAAARGVAGVEAMTDAEALDLIFASGLSTASEVTGLSGRGVGMDAVRAAVERIGGRVSVASRPGHGTLVRFTMPFTVMMTAVMTVEAGGQAFGIPLEAVVETASLPRDRIARVGAARAFVLRGRTIPLLDLAEALGLPRAERPPQATILVALTDGQPTGFEVERLGGRLDVLLTPMEGLLAGTPGIAGTTLTGDGRVLLVLDLQELVR